MSENPATEGRPPAAQAAGAALPRNAANWAMKVDRLTVDSGGGLNVAGTLQASYPLFSAESLLAADPDLLLSAGHERAGLAALARRYPHLKASRTGAVRTLSDDLISRPGPRVALALREVKAALEAAPSR